MSRTAAAIALLICSLGVALAQIDFLGAPCASEVCDNGMKCLEVTSGSPCSWDGWGMDTPCTCGGAGGETDPYFTGFSGQSFYFVAEADHTYNILSEEVHQLNAAFVATELPPESDLIGLVTGAKNSSFIGALALRYKNSTVEVAADHVGDLKLFINGEGNDMGGDAPDFEETVQVENGLIVTIERYPVIAGTTIKIETPLMMISTYPTSEHEDNMGNMVRGHLNLHLSLKVSRLEAPPTHGVLGQTLHEDMGIDMAAPDAFPGEGTAEDYVVSSLFGTDFVFNRFTGASTAAVPAAAPSEQTAVKVRQAVTDQAQQAVSRRMLAAQPKRDPVSLEASFGPLRARRQ